MPFRNKTVLVVDDDPNILNFCKRIYENEGFKTRLASDGLAALSVDPDDVILLVTDYDMPGLNGPDVIKMFQTKKKVPAILISAHPIDADKLLIFANAVIRKPFDRGCLLNISKDLVTTAS